MQTFYKKSICGNAYQEILNISGLSNISETAYKESFKIIIEGVKEKVKHTIDIKYIDSDTYNEIEKRVFEGIGTKKEIRYIKSIRNAKYLALIF